MLFAACDGDRDGKRVRVVMQNEPVAVRTCGLCNFLRGKSGTVDESGAPESGSPVGKSQFLSVGVD